MITVMQKFVYIFRNLPTSAENQILDVKTILYVVHRASEADDAIFKQEQFEFGSYLKKRTFSRKLIFPVVTQKRCITPTPLRKMHSGRAFRAKN